jgi:RimJ/RimL family protein N-acetyltransferase
VKPFEPVVLTGDHVRLEPLTPRHVPGLVAAAAEDRSTYDWTPVPNGDPELRAAVELAERERVAGIRLGFATVHLLEVKPSERREADIPPSSERGPSGAPAQPPGAERVVGSTSFLDPQRWQRSDRAPSFDSIEIGSTWLAASAQRTVVNTEAKLLMLDHAFGVWNVHRVVLNTDARNERSRAAIERIGATFEGVLHGFRMGVEGTPRDTATFAITARDWPEVHARLVARLKPA